MRLLTSNCVYSSSTESKPSDCESPHKTNLYHTWSCVDPFVMGFVIISVQCHVFEEEMEVRISKTSDDLLT